MTDGKVIYGIIGFGGMGKWHSDVLKRVRGARLAGAYDIKKERMDLAAELGYKTYESQEAMLQDPELDIILIATPNDCHRPIAIAAMEAGKHVIVEKPVTLSTEDLKAMIEVSKKTGKLFTVHQNRRWDEDFLAVKKIISENQLGKIFRLESRVHGCRGIPGDWRQKKEYGGGMVYDWGVHLLDQILLLTEDRKLETVYAMLTNVTNQVVDDGFTACLTFEGNLQVIVEVETSNFISLPRWYLLGENGTAVIEDWNLNGKIVKALDTAEGDVVPVKTAAGITKTMAPRKEENLVTCGLPEVESDVAGFQENIVNALTTGEVPEVKLNQVERVLKLIEAIFMSAEKKKVIYFEGGMANETN